MLLQHLGEAEKMEFYFGSRSFDPTSMRQGSVAWMVNAGLVRAAAPAHSIRHPRSDASAILVPHTTAGCAWLGRPAGWDVRRRAKAASGSAGGDLRRVEEQGPLHRP